MSDFITGKKGDFEKSVEHFKHEISSLRTGRATPALVEDIQVTAYDTKTPLQGLASISAPDPQTIRIEPWDKSILKNIERAIQESDIGINPVVDSNVVRLNMPQMTEETRAGLVKQLKEKSEASKVAIRSVREKVRNEINDLEKAKEISEDDKYAWQEELDKVTKEFTTKIDTIEKDKEAEIMKI